MTLKLFFKGTESISVLDPEDCLNQSFLSDIIEGEPSLKLPFEFNPKKQVSKNMFTT